MREGAVRGDAAAWTALHCVPCNTLRGTHGPEERRGRGDGGEQTDDRTDRWGGESA